MWKENQLFPRVEKKRTQNCKNILCDQININYVFMYFDDIFFSWLLYTCVYSILWYIFLLSPYTVVFILFYINLVYFFLCCSKLENNNMMRAEQKKQREFSKLLSNGIEMEKYGARKWKYCIISRCHYRYIVFTLR